MSALHADIAVVGAGVAGLWCRAALERAGYSTVTLERSALGQGQTIASQGILHRGVKYAFSADAARASETLLEAERVWDAALAGGAERASVQGDSAAAATAFAPDLRAVRVLAWRMHMWSLPGVFSRLTGAMGARALRSGVRELAPDERPEAFHGAPAGVTVWEVAERAVESASLLRELARAGRGPVRCGVGIESITPAGAFGGEGGVDIAVSAPGGERGVLRVGAVVLSAGEGNEALLRLAGRDPTTLAQRRPLHMVIADDAPAALFGHCVQALSDKPRLTVTSALRAGVSRAEVTWWLGGMIAESGVGLTPAEQAAAARVEARACLPWLDLSRTTFRTMAIDRAEGRAPGGKRPDTPVTHRLGPVIAVWPTKLALAPTAAGMVLTELREAGVRPTGVEVRAGVLPGASVDPGALPIAPYPWDVPRRDVDGGEAHTEPAGGGAR